MDERRVAALRLAGDVLGLLALVLAAWTLIAAGTNRSLQTEVTANGQQIARAKTLANVNNGLIQLLAKAAAEKQDVALRALLAQNGVTFQVRPADAAPPAGN